MIQGIHKKLQSHYKIAPPLKWTTYTLTNGFFNEEKIIYNFLMLQQVTSVLTISISICISSQPAQSNFHSFLIHESY